MKSFDEINEIICSMDDTLFYLVKRGLDEYFFHGNAGLLTIASQKTALSVEEILEWYSQT